MPKENEVDRIAHERRLQREAERIAQEKAALAGKKQREELELQRFTSELETLVPMTMWLSSVLLIAISMILR